MRCKKDGILGFFATVRTPVLAGAGEGTGRADTSIQRNSVSKIPKIDSSVWRGSVTELLPFALEKKNSKDKFAGKRPKISFSDLRLLLFPVRSSSNLFTLLTCPGCLREVLRDMNWYGYLPKAYSEYENKVRYYEDTTMWKGDFREEYELLGQDSIQKKGNHEDPDSKKELFSMLGFEEHVIQRIGIVSDELFVYFVERETEVAVRNKTEGQGLFTEEYLPEESVLYGFINEFKDIVYPAENVLEAIHSELKRRCPSEEGKGFTLQLGKNETLGKGRLFFREMNREFKGGDTR